MCVFMHVRLFMEGCGYHDLWVTSLSRLNSNKQQHHSTSFQPIGKPWTRRKPNMSVHVMKTSTDKHKYCLCVCVFMGGSVGVLSVCVWMGVNDWMPTSHTKLSLMKRYKIAQPRHTMWQCYVYVLIHIFWHPEVFSWPMPDGSYHT